MSSNVGLSTPRGSGTSGYVQRNAAFIKPRATGYGQPYPPVSGANSASERGGGFTQRVPDRQILEHDRRRAVEVRVMELREELEEANERVEDAAPQEKGAGRDMPPPPPPSKKQFKSYQVHELAEAKIEESERLRRALGIREDRETGEISGRRRRD
ncbi:hypothetical protein BP00DRAFT_408972 [Aspergillus indologenus CBS 114.80]|uniref:CWF21 domain-containing protein n=1 Tax=Aspergillus indologenus CBS 114.80 TaxID=1450541 RepID=A0A2V5IP44_9EURO|nr:hypothetical protein BP00DRAFT_408972 [Aspergillus indologenus CBS 114.80]